MSKLEKFEVDCLVIGGGVSGIAIARELSSKFDNIFLIERNNQIAQETSSRNSEVIHAGMYYDQGSLKSKLCLRGKELLYDYLKERKIEFNRCGKYIVSTSDKETEKRNKKREKLRLYVDELRCNKVEKKWRFRTKRNFSDIVEYNIIRLEE